MSLKPGASASFSLILKLSGQPVRLTSAAVVTARFNSSAGAQLVGPLTLSSTAMGANWQAGQVVVELTAEQTALFSAPAVEMVITATENGSSRNWTSNVDVAPVESERSALFVRDEILPKIRRDQLMLASETFLSGITLSDDYLFDKIKAAEMQAQHYIRCYLAPTVIIPDDAAQSEVDALEVAGTRYAQEAAYDYDSDFFSGDRWGYIVTKSKPLQSVQSIRFSYPSPIGQVFELPHEWIRADKKYGHIRIVPTALSASVPMAAFIMQSISGGRSIPFMIQVRYTAGIKDAHSEYPELVSAIKRLAVLNILKDSFTPQSGSISADGLSQSVSADMDKYSDSVDKTLDAVRDSIHGIRFTVC